MTTQCVDTDAADAALCRQEQSQSNHRAGGVRGGTNPNKESMNMDKIYTLIASLYTGMYDRDESDDRGAGMTEYALLVALVGVVLIGTLGFLTGGIQSALDSATTALGGATG
jgi:Flp pilus assembly pilin Flp